MEVQLNFSPCHSLLGLALSCVGCFVCYWCEGLPFFFKEGVQFMVQLRSNIFGHVALWLYNLWGSFGDLSDFISKSLDGSFICNASNLLMITCDRLLCFHILISSWWCTIVSPFKFCTFGIQCYMSSKNLLLCTLCCRVLMSISSQMLRH